MRATVPTPKQGSGCFDYTLIEAAKLNGVNIQASMLGTGLDLNFVKELPQLTKLAISESRDLDLAPVAKIDLRPKFPLCKNSIDVRFPKAECGLRQL